MSLQARGVNNENAGVAPTSFKPGEAPMKQTGPTKRKGLSEMGSNQLMGPRQLGSGLKLQQAKPAAKPIRKKKPVYEEPIEMMYPSTDLCIEFRDPLVESSLACDLSKDSTWGITDTGMDEDYFTRENRRFGLSVDPLPEQEPVSDFIEEVLDIPDFSSDVYDN